MRLIWPRRSAMRRKTSIRAGIAVSLPPTALCEICQDESRLGSEICVVEQATDILSIERTGFFRGRYHVLGGRLAPLDHIGPDQLRIQELITRVQLEKPSEIILALSADVEGRPRQTISLRFSPRFTPISPGSPMACRRVADWNMPILSLCNAP